MGTPAQLGIVVARMGSSQIQHVDGGIIVRNPAMTGKIKITVPAVFLQNVPGVQIVDVVLMLAGNHSVLGSIGDCFSSSLPFSLKSSQVKVRQGVCSG